MPDNLQVLLLSNHCPVAAELELMLIQSSKFVLKILPNLAT